MDSDSAAVTLPPWVLDCLLPAWVCTTGGEVIYVNRVAECFWGLPGLWQKGGDCKALFRAVGELGTLTARGASSDDAICRITAGYPSVTPIRIRARRWDGQLSSAEVMKFELKPDRGLPLRVHVARSMGRLLRMEQYFTRVATRMPSPAGPGGERLRDLSQRERQILSLLAADATCSRISERLHLSLHTVHNHVRNLREKLGVGSIQEAVAIYLLRSE